MRDCEDPWDIERVLEWHMVERWNRRAERTCRPEVCDDGAGAWGVYCSECGYRFAGPHGKLLDECADVIQATLNLVAALGVEDFRPWVKECERRNRERGRITDGKVVDE